MTIPNITTGASSLASMAVDSIEQDAAGDGSTTTSGGYYSSTTQAMEHTNWFSVPQLPAIDQTPAFAPTSGDPLYGTPEPHALLPNTQTVHQSTPLHLAQTSPFTTALNEAANGDEPPRSLQQADQDHDSDDEEEGTAIGSRQSSIIYDAHPIQTTGTNSVTPATTVSGSISAHQVTSNAEPGDEDNGVYTYSEPLPRNATWYEESQWTHRFLAAATPLLASCADAKARRKRMEHIIIDVCGGVADRVWTAYLWANPADRIDHRGRYNTSEQYRNETTAFAEHWIARPGEQPAPPAMFRQLQNWQWPANSTSTAPWPVQEGPMGELLRQDVAPPDSMTWDGHTSIFYEGLQEAGDWTPTYSRLRRMWKRIRERRRWRGGFRRWSLFRTMR